MPDAPVPGRRPLRHPGHDYDGPAVYFVTICAHERRSTFGSTRGHAVNLSPLGLLVERCWTRIPEVHPAVGLDLHVIMPNHLHGIVMVGVDPDIDGRPSLGRIVGGFKEAATRDARSAGLAGPDLWQRGYHDRIVRSPRELAAIREYILANPSNWRQDEEFTAE